MITLVYEIDYYLNTDLKHTHLVPQYLDATKLRELVSLPDHNQEVNN